MPNTPCFPVWSSQFRRELQRVRTLTGSALHQFELLFQPFIPRHLLAQEDEGPHSRDRCWNLRLVFWSFLWQVAQAGASCREAIRQAQCLCRLQGGRIPPDTTSPYCQSQMGKSSLMVRTASKLREQGVSVLVLDLTAVGQPETKEQWYGGLLMRLGTQARLEDELEEFWWKNELLSPAQRFFTAIHKIILGKADGAVVIFVDELDVVRSLPFSTDEFFAAIRECHTRRVEEPALERLTFCLLGVATPGDLIRDTRLTPFNIGRRIELNDFTPAEAAPLAQGLATSSTLNPQLSTPLLERVLYWTDGHPYLTQRLCQALAAGAESRSPESVDRTCEALFFAARAREQDDNLLFVRERLLRAEVDRAGLLHLYGQVRGHKRVRDDEGDPLVGTLRLSGITAVSEGCLTVRNRIYEHVFDQQWMRANLPDAEVRRQKAAFRRGIIRATGVAAAVLGVMAALVAMAIRQAHRANQTANTLRRNVYATDMKLAQVLLDENNFGRAAELVRKYLPQPGQEDLRGFEWRYLWKLCQSDTVSTFQGHQLVVTSVAFSPDDKILATASWDGTVHLWARNVTNPPSPFKSFSLSRPLSAVAFSPDGRKLAAADDEEIYLWHTADWQPAEHVATSAHGVFLRHISFSKDGRTLAAQTVEGVTLFDTARWEPIMTIRSEGDEFRSADMSPDGKLWAATRGRQIELWDLSSRARVTNFVAGSEEVWAVAFSPKDNLLATGDETGVVRLWDTEALQEVATWKAHAVFLLELSFSPDGAILATGGGDQLIRCWNVAALRQQASDSTTGPSTASLATLRGHRDQIWALAFSADGRFLASGSQDETARLWSVRPEQRQQELTNGVILLWLSPNGQTMAALNKDTRDHPQADALAYWAVASGKQTGAVNLPIDFQAVSCVVISPNGRRLGMGLTNGIVELWDLETRVKQTTLKGHDRTIESLGFSSNNQRLASREQEGTIRVWELGTATELSRFSDSGTFAFSSDGELLITTRGGSATLWEVAGKQKLATLDGHKRPIGSTSFSPDGELVATGSDDSTARLWQVPSGRLVAVLKGHIAGVEAVGFSPDGKTLVTAANDDTVKLWNVATRNEMLTLKESNKGARVMFSADGTTLAAGYPYLRNARQHIKLWRAPSLAEIDALESAATQRK